MTLRLGWSSVIAACCVLLACGDGGGRPFGWRATPDGDGPVVAWDIYHRPLPDIPLPNDTATWPDPSSPTGLRLNASMVAPTDLERTTRSRFDELDGWGTFAPITVGFDARIDLDDLMARQGGSEHFHESDWARHAIYLINMETGLPVPLDLNGGNFYYSSMHTDQYFDNDPRSAESNVFFETVEEDLNGNGILDPGEDTDYDGVLDHPNTFDGSLTGDPLDTYDRMTWFYERETNTLIVRPILPLTQATTYAVVITNRLVGEASGSPVRSPFDHVHHVRQAKALEWLPTHLAAHPELYGSLATNGWEDVAFAWTFTTQTVSNDLDTIREGLYGRGTMARLAEQFPADVIPLAAQGGRGCPAPTGSVYVASGEAFKETMAMLAGIAFGLNDEEVALATATFDNLSHVVVAMFDSPHFFADPDHEDLQDAFEMDYVTGEARVTNEVLTMVMYIPKESAGRAQPFDPVFYVHGHGSNASEALLYAGLFIQQGNALVTMNAQGHGLELDAGTASIVSALFGGACLTPFFDAVKAGRARDLDDDGAVDSGADFWTAYIFHTRDVVRQTAVDHMQAIRVLRSFDGVRRAGSRTLVHPDSGEAVSFDGDMDGDGSPDLAGDFDGNGVPDLGGPSTPINFSGGSLGGIITQLMSGLEPAISSSVPIVGGGGLGDISIRTENGAVLPTMMLRVMGPLVVGSESAGPDDNTSCAAGDYSLKILATSLSHARRTEIACVPAADMAGDDLLVVRNLTNGEVGCSGTNGGAPGTFRVSVPSDAGDRWVVEHYRHGRDAMYYGDCEWIGAERQPDRVIDTWEVGQGTGAGRCAQCAQFASTTWEVGDPLVAPAAGFGRHRQTPELRRLMMLGQAGLEKGDPINYARRVFLDPARAVDVPEFQRSILVANTTGDPNVCIATGYAFARAAGIIPFLPPDAPAHLADYRAPASFQTTYPGVASPNDLLNDYGVIEAVPRLERAPVAGGGERFLADIDDLSDGRLAFAPDGHTQLSTMEGGLTPVRGAPPLRWVRASRPMSGPADDAVWDYVDGTPMSGMANLYVIPNGAHGPSSFFDPTLLFDSGVYGFSLASRYLSTRGTEITYARDPAGHHCLEDSSCEFILP